MIHKEATQNKEASQALHPICESLIKPLTLCSPLGSVTLASRIILAPMAGVTDWPFRTVVKEFGAGLVVSEMVTSRAVVEAIRHPVLRKRLRLFDPAKESSPVSVQLVGYDPEVMAEAARFNEDLGAQLLDINMGCPVKKVVKTDAGAALMRDEDLARRIIRSVVRAVRLPVTVKMRLGWDHDHLNAASLIKIAEEEGAAAVTVHARTRSQFYMGHADWKALKALKEGTRLPLFGNGDVTSFEAAEQLLEESGVDGIAIGRGACGRPWFLRDLDHYLRTGERTEPPSVALRFETIQRHWDRILTYYGTEQGVLLARKHLGWYSRGLPFAADFRLAVNSLTDPSEIEAAMKKFFLREESQDPSL